MKQVVSTTKKERPTLCTNEVIEDVEECMENNPSTSLDHMSQEVGFSVGTCHKIVKKNSPFPVQTSRLLRTFAG